MTVDIVLLGAPREFVTRTVCLGVAINRGLGRHAFSGTGRQRRGFLRFPAQQRFQSRIVEEQHARQKEDQK